MIIKQNRGRVWLDWQRRMGTAAQMAGVVACVWLLLAFCFGEMGLPRYLAMREQVAQLDRDLLALRRDNGGLRGEIARLQHDPAKIEQLARERLGYVRKGETVYQLSPDPVRDRSLQETP